MNFATRPTLQGFGGAVSAGHYLATQIGAQVLAEGGNAADAACAMGFALQVLEPTQNGPAGEVPILVYVAAEDRTYALSGQGPAPAAASIAAMRERGIESIPPDGLLAATIPAALDAWCQLLERFGTRRLADVIAPARGLAERGFPMYRFLQVVLKAVEERVPDETVFREAGFGGDAFKPFLDRAHRAEQWPSSFLKPLGYSEWKGQAATVQVGS